MNIHIVCRDHDTSDRILPRFARTLVKHNNWTLSGSPDPHADLNYFSVYIERAERFASFSATPTAAYFSHHERHITKHRWWESAARSVDLRIVTAMMWGAEIAHYGPTMQAHPPVDLSLFKIGISPRPFYNRIGLSGYIPKFGTVLRKGQYLVDALKEKRIMQHIELVACGSGWPVPTREYKYRELPRFYQSLNALLCTSVLEGNPMPPLEALACGIPIIIPRRVGLLDELPDIEGIYRYDRGDENSMTAAIERFVARPNDADPEELRNAVLPYDEHNWAREHKAAFLHLLEGVS